MREALELARGGIEAVSPNPLVGAVIVRGGKVVGRGYHQRFGGPHAEVHALADAGRRARGADVYVTLEPCGHHGKTPPCASALIDAGVARVFYSAADPNPETRGVGPRALRRAGIEVAGGVLRREGLELNAPYFHWRREGRPWVIVKWAMSLDGKIATVSGESRWITGPDARAWAHGVRRRVDAILVGTRTARLDDPRLTARPARGRRPLRIVLDRRGRLPLDLKILDGDSRRAGSGDRLYVVGPSVKVGRRRAIDGRGIDVLEVPEADGKLSVEALLDELGARGVSQLLVEGGGEVVGSFFDSGAVDEVLAFIGPKILCGRDAAVPVGGRGFERLAEAITLERIEEHRVGKDLILRGIVAGGASRAAR